VTPVAIEDVSPLFPTRRARGIGSRFAALLTCWLLGCWLPACAHTDDVVPPPPPAVGDSAALSRDADARPVAVPPSPLYRGPLEAGRPDAKEAFIPDMNHVLKSTMPGPEADEESLSEPAYPLASGLQAVIADFVKALK